MNSGSNIGYLCTNSRNCVSSIEPGAMVITKSSISIRNSTFHNNQGIEGGSIKITTSNLTVENSKFSNSTSPASGGAVYATESSSVRLTHVLFEQCEAPLGGVVEVQDAMSKLSVNCCAFRYCGESFKLTDFVCVCLCVCR